MGRELIEQEVPPRAAIYCRISQDRSGEQLGVERQEEECRAFAAVRKWEVVAVYADDNISAFSERARPQFDRLLADVEAGEIDIVLAWHSDRLYRGFAALERLTKSIKDRAVVHTVKAGELDLTTPTGVMLAEMLASIAKHESAQKGERIKAKHAQSARMGLAHGGMRPYGYARVDGKPGTLVVVEEEARVIREAAERVLAGESVRAISIDFTARGIPTAKGGRWQLKALSSILASPRLAALRPVGGDAVAPAAWEPILDKATWERVRTLVTHGTVGRRPRANVLSGFMWCGRCGQRMFGVSSSHRGKARRRYECRRDGHGLGACAALSIEAGPVEAYITGLVFGAAQGADLGQVRRSRREGDQTVLAARLEQDETMLTELAQDMAERRITRAEWFAARGPVEERIVETRKALAKLAPDDPIPADLADVESRWETLTFDQRRAVIGLFIDKVIVDPAAHHGGRFDPQRVRAEWKV